MVTILKDIYHNRFGDELIISGSGQDKNARTAGLNLLIMKAFASAAGEIQVRHEDDRLSKVSLNFGRPGKCSQTETISTVFNECSCHYCRSHRNSKGNKLVVKEQILYQGELEDLERIAIEVGDIPKGPDSDKHLITLIGLATVRPVEEEKEDFDLIDFEAEDHGVIEVDPDKGQLCPYPVMLDVPSEEELKISREWRSYINPNDIPVEVRENFEKVLDKHKTIFAYGPNEVRFVKEDGKTAELDLEMESDKPIWTKPFGLAGPILEKLENKIEELLDAGLIEPVRTNWNSPIFMVPHNSAAKNEAVEERKYRMIVDLRVVNSMVKFSNRYSYLVKGIEFAMERLR